MKIMRPRLCNQLCCTCENATTEWAVGIECDVVIAKARDQLLLHLAGDCAVHALVLMMILLLMMMVILLKMILMIMEIGT